MHNPYENMASATYPSSPMPSNWSPQQQTARMLALCEAQMEAATQDSDQAVDTLVQAFTELTGMVQELTRQSTTQNAVQDAALTDMNERCSRLSSQVAAAIVAFQFYDKLSQRLGHVRYSLSTLALFVCDRSNSQSPEHWDKLLATLSRLYRTAEERAIFDSIAGSLALHAMSNGQPLVQPTNSPAGSVELF